MRAPVTFPQTARRRVGSERQRSETDTMPHRERRVRIRPPTPGKSVSSSSSRDPGKSSGRSTVKPSALSMAEAILASHRFGAQPIEHVICDPCQWQPKTAHFGQLKTAHFGEIHLGRSGRSPVDARRAFWAGRRERSDRSPGQHAPRSCAAGGHVATPSRCCSDAARSQC